ncbi:MAG: peptidoglycan DD-metalloendopeptidase family protein [Chromatiales bacterium]|nr:peptidoglycan DD-metalloendopeptidase family protein [Chromatiales bacterium]
MIAPLLLGAMLAVGAEEPASPAEAERALAALREQIREVEREQRRAGERMERAQRELRTAEQAGQQARSRLLAIEGDQARTRDRIAALEQDVAIQRAALDSQQETLAAQLRHRHVARDNMALQLLLAQQDPMRLDRHLAWHGYLAQAQLALLRAIEAELVGLSRTAEALAREASQLAELAQRQRTELERLEAARRERTRALELLAAGVSDADARLAQLNEEAAGLEALLQRLRAAVARAPAAVRPTGGGPFAQARRQLAWPVQGQVLGDFGRPRPDGRLRWDGLLLAAEAGTPVRAVWHGTVVYADWLPGLGLLTVVDHGGGYMSLYGHNQVLLREVGEQVAAGDVIGEAGDSGGQARSALYFGLRKDGQPVNPNDWLPPR